MYEDYPLATFKSFTWSRNDIIGAGATSLVYKAICQVWWTLIYIFHQETFDLYFGVRVDKVYIKIWVSLCTVIPLSEYHGIVKSNTGGDLL